MSSFVCWVSSSSQENYDICKETQQWGIGKNSGVANSHVAKVKKGEVWSYICYIQNCPTWNAALQCEWRWKQLSRQIQKEKPKQLPRERRLEALKKLLSLDKPTSKADLYSSWQTPPEVIYIN